MMDRAIAGMTRRMDRSTPGQVLRAALGVVPVFTVCIASCGGSKGNAGTATIGPAGGSVVLDAVTLTVPAGALASDTQIQISKVPTSSLSAAAQTAFTFYSEVYQLAPSGLTLAQPVTLKFSSTTAPAETYDSPDTETTYIFWSDASGGYTPLTPVVGADGSLTVQNSHFSTIFEAAIDAAADATASALTKYCNFFSHGTLNGACCGLGLNLCGAGLKCTQGTCRIQCGMAGQYCCPMTSSLDSARCADDLYCDTQGGYANGLCVANNPLSSANQPGNCGGTGQTCCSSGDPCTGGPTGGLVCYTPPMGGSHLCIKCGVPESTLWCCSPNGYLNQPSTDTGMASQLTCSGDATCEWDGFGYTCK